MRGDLAPTRWRKSTFSSSEGANCVEVADLASGGRAVRDSKNQASTVLTVPAGAWSAFTTAIRDGEFD